MFRLWQRMTPAVRFGDVKVDKLRDTDTGRIQKLKHSLVAIALRVHALRLLKQKIDFLAGEYLRELLGTLLGDELERGILLNDLLYDEVCIKALRGRYAA